MRYNECNLLVDAGEKHFGFALITRDDPTFAVLEYYQFSAEKKEEELRELLSSNTLLQLDYPSVHVFYNNASGILIPERYYDPETSNRMLELVAGDVHSSMPMFDEVPQMNLRNIYAVPAYLHEVMVHHFPHAVFGHFQSALLKKNSLSRKTGDRIDLIVYPELVITTLWLKGNLHLMQCHSYETPDDITWHLLNLARQWDLDQEEIPVVVSGLVEKNSLLYAAADRYFQHVETEDRPPMLQYDPAFDNYPPHFFSPMFSLGLCVS